MGRSQRSTPTISLLMRPILYREQNSVSDSSRSVSPSSQSIIKTGRSSRLLLSHRRRRKVRRRYLSTAGSYIWVRCITPGAVVDRGFSTVTGKVISAPRRTIVTWTGLSPLAWRICSRRSPNVFTSRPSTLVITSPAFQARLLRRAARSEHPAPARLRRSALQNIRRAGPANLPPECPASESARRNFPKSCPPNLRRAPRT
jgi:hypothetical protein